MTRIKFMENVGKVATVTAVAMYVSYFPQIMNNLAHPGTGDWIQPLVAAINCTLWVAYGLFKEHSTRHLLRFSSSYYSSYVISHIRDQH